MMTHFVNFVTQSDGGAEKGRGSFGWVLKAEGSDEVLIKVSVALTDINQAYTEVSARECFQSCAYGIVS